MTHLSIRDLTASYGARPVLSGVDLEVPDGALTAVLGPSGCGKTTLLRMIAGFLRPLSGSITIGSTMVCGPSTFVAPEHRRIGVVPQEGALFPHLPVDANIAFGLRSVGRAERRRRVEELLDLVGLAGYGPRMPHELSGGQQQRVALARALAPGPRLVLLDEPFNALDSGLRAGLRADVRQALHAAGATAILVTHDQQEALSVADLVSVMRDGRIVQTGPPDTVYRQPADPQVAAFVGDAVILPARSRHGTVTTALGDIPTTTSENGTGSAEDTGMVVLRPEQLALGGGGTRGRVIDIAFYGHDAMVRLAVEGMEAPVNVRVAGPVDAHPGDEADIAVVGPALFFPAPH